MTEKKNISQMWGMITETEKDWAVSMLEEAAGTKYENIISKLEPVYARMYGFDNSWNAQETIPSGDDDTAIEIDEYAYAEMQEESEEDTLKAVKQLNDYTKEQNAASDADLLTKLTYEQCTAIAMILQTELASDVQLKRTAMMVAVTSLRKWMIQLAGKYLLATPQERQDFYQDMYGLVERKLMDYDTSENSTIHTYLYHSAKHEIQQIVSNIKGWKTTRYDREFSCKIERARRALQNEGNTDPDENQIVSKLAEAGECLSATQVRNIIDRSSRRIVSSDDEMFNLADTSISVEDSVVNSEFRDSLGSFVEGRLNPVERALVEFYRCVSEGMVRPSADAKYNYVISVISDKSATRSDVLNADDSMKSKMKTFVRRYGQSISTSAPKINELSF